MLESLSKNNDRMIVRDRQKREYRLQVNGDEDSYFIAKLLYRNSEVGRLQCVLYPPDKLVISDDQETWQGGQGQKTGEFLYCQYIANFQR